MKGKKDFDCVEVKWEIQRRIMEEYGNLCEEEVRRPHWEKLNADPFWKARLAAVPVHRGVTTRDSGP